MPRTMPIVLDRGGPSLDLRLPRLALPAIPWLRRSGTASSAPAPRPASLAPRARLAAGAVLAGASPMSTGGSRRAPAIPSRGAPCGADAGRAGSDRVRGGCARVGSRGRASLAHERLDRTHSGVGGRLTKRGSGKRPLREPPYPHDEGEATRAAAGDSVGRAPRRASGARHRGPPAARTTGAPRPPTDQYGACARGRRRPRDPDRPRGPHGFCPGRGARRAIRCAGRFGRGGGRSKLISPAVRLCCCAPIGRRGGIGSGGADPEAVGRFRCGESCRRRHELRWPATSGGTSAAPPGHRLRRPIPRRGRRNGGSDKGPDGHADLPGEVRGHAVGDRRALRNDRGSADAAQQHQGRADAASGQVLKLP